MTMTTINPDFCRLLLLWLEEGNPVFRDWMIDHGITDWLALRELVVRACIMDRSDNIPIENIREWVQGHLHKVEKQYPDYANLVAICRRILEESTHAKELQSRGI